MTIHGSDYDYSILLPDPGKWRLIRRDYNADLKMYYRDVYISVAVQRLDSGDNQDLYRLMREQIRHSDPEATVSEATPVTIDETEWLHFEVFSTVNKTKLAYSYDIHSGEAGTFEIMGWTGANLFEEERPTIGKIASSFRFGPEIKAAIKAAASRPKPSPSPAPAAGKPGSIPEAAVPDAASVNPVNRGVESSRSEA
jgi:hypothetical protein